MNNDYKKYLIVLLITAGIFIAVFGLVSFINGKKLANIDDLQRKITADLIATETQFDLLKTAPCESLNNTILSRELGELGEKLDFAQENQGADDPDVEQLKKYYSLLQVKDYLLTEELSSKCKVTVDSILYFYSSDCTECTKQGYILTEFKKQYPDIRIYSFDTDLDFSVIDTFVSLYDFDEIYPTLIAGGDVYQELKTLEDLESMFPELVEHQKIKDRAEDGVLYLLDQESYADVKSEAVVFKGTKGNTYTYSITISDEIETVSLVFDEEDETFSLQE